MSASAVVYAFAVAPDLPRVAGAAPAPVLARQVPRLAVQLLNGGGDRGLRFFPFLGRDARGRRFLDVHDLLPLPSLLALHGQSPRPRVIVDGRLEGEALRLRIADGETGTARFDARIPFDMRDPLPALQRLMFELGGALGWSGAPPPVSSLGASALRSYMLARDDLLRLEAGIGVADARRSLAEAVRPLRQAPRDPELQEVVVQVAARLVAAGAAREVVARTVRRAAERVLRVDDSGSAGFAARVAAVLEGCGQADAAAELRAVAVRRGPDQVEAAVRAAARHFECGRFVEARAVLERVRAAGHANAAVLAQLLLVDEQEGRSAARAALARELAGRPDLTPPMARVAASCLLAEGALDEALDLARRARDSAPEEPASWLDEGRLLLAAGREDEAGAAFEACLARSPSEAMAREAGRSRDLSRVPGAAASLRGIDADLAAGRGRAALRRARALLRRGRHLPESWLALGIARQRLGHHRRARRALARAVALRPDLGEAHDRLGILWVRARRAGRGRRHLEEAVRLLPGEPGPWIHLAQACALLGDDEAGVAALSEAARLGAEPETLEAVRGTFFAR